MKKEALVSILILGLGLMFECLYLITDSTFFGIKFYLLGHFCILIGAIGFWVYTLLPFINSKLGGKKKKT